MTSLDHSSKVKLPYSLRSGASVLALCVVAATPAYAQTAATTTTAQADAAAAQAGQGQTANSTNPNPPPSGAIVVTGIRQSLRNSQQIKRNSDTVVDAITSQDIGALPDRSVTEALQRVPGV